MRFADFRPLDSTHWTLVPNMLPLPMVDVREYLDAEGNSPFAVWFDDLNAPAAAKVTMAVTRLGQGNFSSVKGVGSGVLEYKIDFGPGYRIHLGKDGDCLVILLGRIFLFVIGGIVCRTA